MRESKKTNRKNYLAVTEGYTNDIRILTALYFGNHLEEKEIKRATDLLYLLNIDLKRRIK